MNIVTRFLIAVCMFVTACGIGGATIHGWNSSMAEEAQNERNKLFDAQQDARDIARGETPSQHYYFSTTPLSYIFYPLLGSFAVALVYGGVLVLLKKEP